MINPKSRSPVQQSARVEEFIEQVSAKLKGWQKIDYEQESEGEKNDPKGQEDDRHRVTKRHDLRYVLDQERPMEWICKRAKDQSRWLEVRHMQRS